MSKRRVPGTTRIAGEIASRRAVLAGFGIAGAGTLAACSSSGSNAASTPSASTATSAAAAAPSSAAPTASSSAPAATSAAPAASSAAPAASSAAPAASSAAAVPAGFAVKESEIPVGGGKYFSDDAVIITQPTAGSFRAFTSVCTHQGCPVTQITGGLMICPCHGSEYSIKDGSVVQGPAPSPLAAKKFTLAGGEVIVAKT